MATSVSIVWFRNDLRLHDHEPLSRAIKAGGPIVPLYLFDEKLEETGRAGFLRLGKFRAGFISEALDELEENLRGLNLRLVYRAGRPEAAIPAFAKEIGANALYFHREPGTEEKRVERLIISQLEQEGVEICDCWGNSLFDADQLPFPVAQTPTVFTDFRNKVERNTLPKSALPTPVARLEARDAPPGERPAWFRARAGERENDERTAFPFKGGENAGLERLKDYIWERELLKSYKKTRNGLLGEAYSSKLSPWLACGCLSPRRVVEEVERYEREVVKNDSTYWLKFELIWRDYFRFLLLRFGSAFFKYDGIIGAQIEWKDDRALFEKWAEGKTGYPIVDANMREIAATGFMSNRGRQIVASFLTKNLGLDWRLGAEYFEELLLDYDPASNYGNWNYAAGIGTDPRGYRFFHPIKQAEKYDPDGEYIRRWIPELENAKDHLALTPWMMNAQQQQRAACVIGKDYPERVVDLQKSVKENEIVWKKGLQKSGIRYERNSLVSKFVKK